MKKIAREDYSTFFNDMTSDNSEHKVEVTTFNYDTITGLVSKFNEDHPEGPLVLVTEEDGMVNEIELAFIFEVLLLE